MAQPDILLEFNRLQKEVAELATPTAQVRKIVDSVSEIIGTDVCTLYLKDQHADMALVASHGLVDTGPVSIPAGRGLVGQVAQVRHSLNLAKASEHPDFFYVEGTAEERFQSFCGVPLVHYGKVIGVLVVQRSDAVALPPASEALLNTLCSQLAHIVADMPVTLQGAHINTYVRGVSGSSGIGIGLGVLCDHGDLLGVADEPCADVDSALAE